MTKGRFFNETTHRRVTNEAEGAVSRHKPAFRYPLISARTNCARISTKIGSVASRVPDRCLSRSFLFLAVRGNEELWFPAAEAETGRTENRESGFQGRAKLKGTSFALKPAIGMRSSVRWRNLHPPPRLLLLARAAINQLDTTNGKTRE